MPPDAMAQMLDAMPLRGLVNFGGPEAAAALPALAGYAAQGGAVLNLSERSRKAVPENPVTETL